MIKPNESKLSTSRCPFCGSSAFELTDECDAGRPVLKCSRCTRTWPEDRPEQAAKELNNARMELFGSVKEYNQIALPADREVLFLALNSPAGQEIVKDFGAMKNL